MTKEQANGLNFILELENQIIKDDNDTSIEISNYNNRVMIKTNGNTEYIKEESDNYGQILDIIQSLKECR